MSSFEKILNFAYDGISKPDADQAESVKKNRRPLKMPKGYDFGVRNVNWNDYKDDFILRTDAVWEKSKLLDIFYTHYKSKFIYSSVNNSYQIANIRQMPAPTNEAEHFEDWRQFNGYTDVDGCVW